MIRYFAPAWLPHWMQSTHPIVRHYRSRPGIMWLRQIMFAGVIILFFLLGGLSLPVLYFAFSLMTITYNAASTAHKLHNARQQHTWDLLRVTPISRRELLLSTWAGTVWQLQDTWMLPFYLVLQVLAVLGVVVYGLWFDVIPLTYWAWWVTGGLLVILLQPLADMFYGGMIGVLSAGITRDRSSAQGLALCAAFMYWAAWFIFSMSLLTNSWQWGISGVQLSLLLGIPLVIPLIFGGLAFQLACAVLP